MDARTEARHIPLCVDLDGTLLAADTLWEHLGTHRASTALNFIFPRPLASPELLARVDAWLETTTADPAAVRFVREGRADVARYLAAQAKDAERG